MKLKKYIRLAIRNLFGYDLIRFEPPFHEIARRKKILEANAIDLILDVGANTGQYGLSLRELGYKGKIISFEPLDSARIKLESIANKDGNWTVIPNAVGDKNESSTINISQNSTSSSLLMIEDSHVQYAPQSKVVGVQTVQVITLDSIFSELCSGYKNIYLKIDAQGYEKNVLQGALNCISKVKALQVELSLTPLYAGSPNIIEMINFLNHKGFDLISIEQVFTDSVTGKQLQVDGIFLSSAK